MAKGWRRIFLNFFGFVFQYFLHPFSVSAVIENRKQQAGRGRGVNKQAVWYNILTVADSFNMNANNLLRAITFSQRKS